MYVYRCLVHSKELIIRTGSKHIRHVTPFNLKNESFITSCMKYHCVLQYLKFPNNHVGLNLIHVAILKKNSLQGFFNLRSHSSSPAHVNNSFFLKNQLRDASTILPNQILNVNLKETNLAVLIHRFSYSNNRNCAQWERHIPWISHSPLSRPQIVC